MGWNRIAGKALYYSPFYFLIRRFFAGTSLESAWRTIARLNACGFHPIVNCLTEEVSDPRVIAEVGWTYQMLFRQIVECGPLSDVSLKLSQFGIVNPGFVRKETWPVDFPEFYITMVAANLSKVPVWIDAERLMMRDDTWLLGREILKTSNFLGIRFQAYGSGDFDSIRFFHEVVEKLVESLPPGKTLGLGLCKGAYFSSEESIIRDRNEIISAYYDLMKLVFRLLSQTRERGLATFYPEFDTNDPDLINEIVWEAKRLGPEAKKWFRIAVLLGRAQDYASHLVSQEFNVGVYTPFGKDPFPFYWRRVLEKWEYALAPLALEGKYHRCLTWPERCARRTFLNRAIS